MRKTMKPIKCKKDLYKSTYEGNAFTESRFYHIIDEDDDFFYVLDNMENEFSVCKKPTEGFYYIEDYFYQDGFFVLVPENWLGELLRMAEKADEKNKNYVYDGDKNRDFHFQATCLIGYVKSTSYILKHNDKITANEWKNFKK